MSSRKFSTKLSNLQTFDIAERLIEEFLMDVTCRNLELVGAPGMNQPCRQNQEFAANCLKRRISPFDWQAEKFEPVDQIVAQKNQMEINLVGQEAVGRDIVQREALFEFSDVQFAVGPRFVKVPYALWIQWKIGHKGMVKVILEFPERKLIAFFFGFGLGSADYDEAVGPFPIPRLITELGCLPAAFPEGVVTDTLHLFLNRSGHLCYHCITDIFLVERLDEFVVVEPRVGTDTIEILWYLLADGRPQRLGSRSRMGISRTQNPMPDIPAVSFETDQRMVAGAAGLFGVVSDSGPFYFPAKDWQDSRVQIENETSGDSGCPLNRIAQRIVQPHEAFDLLDGQTLEKISQSRAVGEIAQPQKGLEVTVVMQNPGIRDTFHTGHHRVNYSQNQLGRMIMTVAAFPANVVLEVSLQIEFSTKLLEKNHAAIVRQARILDGKAYFSDASEHTSISSLTVGLMKWAIVTPHYNRFPSPYTEFPPLKCNDSPFFQVHLIRKSGPPNDVTYLCRSLNQKIYL